MKKLKIKKELLGIDIGLDYAGYAVTDFSYHVKKVYGKNIIGIVNFDDAKTAADRRSKRILARRYARRKYRLSLLQELFNDVIMKKDPNFFKRLQLSELKREDKEHSSITEHYTLFNDKKYTDVNFYAEYPTIYHLREALMEKSLPDARLLYLAVRHIIKHRGHFLIEGEFTDMSKIDIIPQIQKLNDTILKRNSTFSEEIADDKIKSIGTLADDVESIHCLETILATKKQNGIALKGKDLTKAVENILGKEQKESFILVDFLYKGNKKATQLFGKHYEGNDITINLDNFNEKISEIEDILQEEDFEIVKNCVEIYSWFTLICLLKGKKSLSEAMIHAYETHKKDLQELKNLLSIYGNKDIYQQVFGKKVATNTEQDSQEDEKKKEKTKCNYSIYVGGGTIVSEKGIDRTKYGEKCSTEDFYKFLKGIFATITVPEAQKTIKSIENRMETGDYMPRIISKNNSTIPYQIHLLELQKILDVAEKSGNFDFLRDVSDGMSVKDKIIKLLEFRIPYYVGPVKNYKEGDETKKHAWATHINADDYSRITPWNFDKRIDLEQCHKDFIKRMTGKCTYLKICDTLPKCSPTNEVFTALNELNGLKINGDLIPLSLKKDIFEVVYCNPDNKVSIRSIQNYLETIGMDSVSIGGYDEKLKGEMKTYKRFKQIFGEKFDKYPKIMEKIALILTIDTDSKVIEKELTEKFGNILSTEEIKKIKGDRYNGWSSLSGEFIHGSLFDQDENGDSKGFFVDNEKRIDILELLKNTNMILNQILFAKEYGLQDRLLQYYQEHDLIDSGNVNYTDIEKLYCSPSVKKCVWQTFRMVKDICETTDSLPERLFIEVTRENKKPKGKTTDSRKDKMIKIYDEAKSFCEKDQELKSDYEKCRKELSDTTPDNIKKEKIFYWFLQLGKSVYTGNTIELDDLDNYDIDHIIPQSKTKDDSIDNKVLVEKEINNKKSDQYPIPESCRRKTLWKKLLKIGLMSREKFDRLARIRSLSPEEEERFINRQLVETAQTALLVRDILKKWFSCVSEDGTLPEIVLVKGENVSDFRKKFNLTKSRDVNDFHHAYDAYMNIIVGNVLNEYFNHNKDYKQVQMERRAEIEIEKEKQSNDKIEKDSRLFMKYFDRYVYSYREKGELIWVPSYSHYNKPTIQIVKKQCQLVPNFVREVKTNKGELYDQTVYKAREGLIPLKLTGFKSNTAKYGGYKTSKTAYFWIIDSVNKKGKPIRSIESVSIYQDTLLKNRKITEDDIMLSFNLINPHKAQIEGIPNAVLKKNSLLRFNNEYYLYLTGCTGNQITFDNANQLFVPDHINAYVKEMRIISDKVMKATATEDKKTVDAKREIECAKLLEEKCKQVDRNPHKPFVVLSKEENEKMYGFFLKKISEKPYKNIPTYDSLYDIMKRGQSYFLNCTLFMQVRILLNLVVAFQCNPQDTDASLIEYCDEKGKYCIGGKNQCNIKINKTISEHNIDLITFSRSGLREKTICINKKR